MFLGPWLQFLITCSMQKWRGKGDLIMCNMTSILHKVDTWGTVPNCYSSQTLIRLPQMYQTTSCTDASFQAFQSLFQEGLQDPLLATGPCVCLPIYHYITLPHAARSPRGSPLCYCKLQVIKNWIVTTAWEQGVGKIMGEGICFKVPLNFSF